LGFFLINDDKNKIKEKKYTFCKDNKIPDNGACIFVNKPKIEVIIFKKITYKLKDYLIFQKEKELSILRIIISEKNRI
jgi:hypothetical protein